MGALSSRWIETASSIGGAAPPEGTKNLTVDCVMLITPCEGGRRPLVVDMLVGDLQRVIEYPKFGFAIEQDVPSDIHDEYERLVRAGFDSRLVRV
jgi:hypothetical protein